VPEHLDYHGGFDNYCAAKLNIARHQLPNSLLITNESNRLLAERTTGFGGTRLHFTEGTSATALVSILNETISITRNGKTTPIIPCKELPVIGPGNLQNALAAITCAASLGASADQIQQGLQSFKPLEHRLEFVGERFGISFYNDSLSTIPEALTHALAALGERVETVIAGGFDRGVDMTTIGPALAMSQVKNLILFPTTGEKIWEAAVAASPNHSYVRVDVQTMEQAVQAAYNLTTAGKTCVMSPASSSFSVFRDYRDRGEQFKNAVQLLAPQNKRSADAV
jgi:UDP-N-acetylmuramoylalanine--D-glutamate ligase